MVAYTKSQRWKKEESERLRGKRDQIKFIDLGFERWHIVRFIQDLYVFSRVSFDHYF